MLQILCICKLWLTLLSGSRRNGRNDNDVADEGIRNHQLIKTVVTCLVNQLAPCVTQLISLSRAELNLRTSLARNAVWQKSVLFLVNFQCEVSMACHDTHEDVAGGYQGRVHANLSPSIDSNFEMFDSLATFTAALPRKEKKELWLRGKNVHFTPWVLAEC